MFSLYYQKSDTTVHNHVNINLITNIGIASHLEIS